MPYIIHYNISALLLMLLIVLSLIMKKDVRRGSSRIFFVLALTHLIAVLFDVGSAITNNAAHLYSNTIRDVFNYGFLIPHNITAFLFVLYIIRLMGVHHKKDFKFYIPFSIPVTVSMVLLILNPRFQWVYYYNEEGIYTHGPLMGVLFLVAYFYLAYTTALTIKYKKAIAPVKYYALLLLIACCVVPVVIQMLMPHLLIELFFQALGVFGILLTIENADEIYNSITKIYNRYAFLTDINAASISKVSFDIITVKLPSTSYFNTVMGITFMNGIMASIASWLQQLDSKVNVYDCEKGHFCLTVFKDSKHSVNDLIGKISEKFHQMWVYDDTRIAFPAQISVFNMPKEITSIEQMMLIIDMPYERKSDKSEVAFRNEINLYQREIDVVHAMEKALGERSFRVYYQPIWSREENKIRSAEALIRLYDERLGNVSPEEFIPVAEKNGLIVAIGEFVFEEVCKLFYQNDLDSVGVHTIDVNLSVIQCMNQNLIRTFQNLLDKYGVVAERINLEITESATINHLELLRAINDLAKLGFTFSLDDYGTGYSNFSHIVNMPFENVKIDKSILWSAGENENARIVLVNIIRMLQEMKIKVIAEGVETQRQKDLLEELKCDYMQGYYFSRPINQINFLEFCRRHNKA